VQDITLRKRMETELQRSENRLQLLQTLPGVGSWELNLDSGKCNWSAETYALLEQDRNLEPSLASFIAMVHPGDRKRVEKAVEQAVKGKREYNAEFRIITPSKKVKHIFSRGRVFFNLGNPVLSGVTWEKPAKSNNSRARKS
jgi:PAS domain-containing protein